MRNARRQPLKEAQCSLCESPWDLHEVGFDGARLCEGCLTCEHDVKWLPEFPQACVNCLRELFTVWTFQGPIIVDRDDYVKFAEACGYDITSVLLWSYADENWRYEIVEKNVADFIPRPIEENPGRDWATLPSSPVSLLGRNDTSPCPPLHRLVRGRTWLTPWDWWSK